MFRGEVARAEAEGQRSAKVAYVVDDDRDMRVSLRMLLQESSIEARPFLSAIDFLEELPNLTPGPILLDVRMPGMDGLALLQALAEREVRWPVIMMTGHAEVQLAVRAMKLGALDFLEKPFPFAELSSLMARAFRVLEEQAKNGVLRDARERLQKLTPRERQILSAVASGLSNKEIALQLDLSHRTVEMHRSRMMRRLGTRKLSEVIAIAAAIR